MDFQTNCTKSWFQQQLEKEIEDPSHILNFVVSGVWRQEKKVKWKQPDFRRCESDETWDIGVNLEISDFLHGSLTKIIPPMLGKLGRKMCETRMNHWKRYAENFIKLPMIDTWEDEELSDFLGNWNNTLRFWIRLLVKQFIGKKFYKSNIFKNNYWGLVAGYVRPPVSLIRELISLRKLVL